MRSLANKLKKSYVLTTASIQSLKSHFIAIMCRSISLCDMTYLIPFLLWLLRDIASFKHSGLVAREPVDTNVGLNRSLFHPLLT